MGVVIVMSSRCRLMISCYRNDSGWIMRSWLFEGAAYVEKGREFFSCDEVGAKEMSLWARSFYDDFKARPYVVVAFHEHLLAYGFMHISWDVDSWVRNHVRRYVADHFPHIINPRVDYISYFDERLDLRHLFFVAIAQHRYMSLSPLHEAGCVLAGVYWDVSVYVAYLARLHNLGDKRAVYLFQREGSLCCVLAHGLVMLSFVSDIDLNCDFISDGVVELMCDVDHVVYEDCAMIRDYWCKHRWPDRFMIELLPFDMKEATTCNRDGVLDEGFGVIHEALCCSCYS